MSNFPKIYSLSTVGIRQHNNYDYLFHEVRTDFTGKNGTGKSIIADIMQLIFIPYSDLWKSGTEGINKQDRKVWGMPLPKEYINFSYAFLNIEKTKRKFITIGVYIPKNHQPVRPFIISKVSETNNKTLVPFDFPLKAMDFLSETKAVFSINDLKQNLLLNDLHLQDFYQKDNINQYFDILYKSQLCPLDLTRENNLKAYAKVLQSFSRAKSLNINNTKSLQDFLFEDDDEIKQTFIEQKEQLENYIKQYRRDAAAINDLARKQQRLIELQIINENYKNKRNDYYSSDTINSFNKFALAKKTYSNNKNSLERAQVNLEKHLNQEKTNQIELYTCYIYIKKLCEYLWNSYKEQKPNFSDEILKAKQSEASELSFTIKTIESINKVYEKYNSSLTELKDKFQDQEKIKNQLEKINRVKNIPSFKEFENSIWAVDYSNARNTYQTRLLEISKEIENLTQLIILYDNNNPNSLFQWAIKQKEPLTLAQETVLMKFKDIATSKSLKPDVKKYTENPSKLLNSYSETESGIWLHLGCLTEYVEYLSNPKFANIENLSLVLENDKIELNKKLNEFIKEKKTIKSIDNDLNEIGYNSEYCNIWKERKRIESYKIDLEVNASTIADVNKVSNSIDKYIELKESHSVLEEEIKNIAKKDKELEIRIKQLSSEIDEYNSKISVLKKNINSPIEEIKLSLNQSLEELEELHKQKKKELEDIAGATDNIKHNVSTQETNIKSCKDQEPLIKTNLDQTEHEFNLKKITLAKETNLIFDSLLQLGDLTDEKIEQLRNEFEFQKEIYRREFSSVVETFEETKGGKNTELRINEYNFGTLVRILCGKFELENLTPELNRLNDEIANFGKLQLEIIFNVFSKVEKNYRELKTLVVRLNNFFKQNKISQDYTFRVEFIEKSDISIGWIDKMQISAKTQSYGRNLFSDLEGYEELSPEQLIVSIAQKFSKIKNCELGDLLNPKYYFELKVGMYDDNNNSNSGSGGQAYTALALLCIGRMSVIQKEMRPGVKFIIIEELSNIDDTNFNTFPEIAKQFGYQLLTMTPKPFGSYTDDDWFLHMLSKGTDKEINYAPMSFFKTKNSKEYLTDYMKRHELENITNTR